MAYTDIDKPDDYFNTVTYTGNGTLATPITGVGFQPDLVWIKNRNNTNNHLLQDSVRRIKFTCTQTQPLLSKMCLVLLNLLIVMVLL
jgi:hypothetical protein